LGGDETPQDAEEEKRCSSTWCVDSKYSRFDIDTYIGNLTMIDHASVKRRRPITRTHSTNFSLGEKEKLENVRCVY
jgi:hypothetical protein